MNASHPPGGPPPFPIFASLAEAQAYSGKIRDPYFEICYHLEAKLNLCLQAMHDLYAHAPANKRPKMQTGLVREILCPQGWPRHPQTLVDILVACARFRREDTGHACTVNQAMTAWDLESQNDATLGHFAVYSKTRTLPAAEADQARFALLRLCDWIESRLHYGTHHDWYLSPGSFSPDPDQALLADIGMTQRHLATLSERDRKRWAALHERAAARHQADLKAWGAVGRAQSNPEPRTWTHPDVDARLIGLWPLVTRYNWTYSDLLNVLDKLLPVPPAHEDREYPLDGEASLKVHCRSVCGLTKSKKEKSAVNLPEGWTVAAKLFPRMGK